MMIAARLAGGNLFLPFLGGGGFWEHSEHSEQLGALGFFEGILWWGILGAARIFLRGFFFLGGWWGVFWIVSVGKN